MSGYLQRLVDSAAPASEPPPLAPVVKSTSPVFEQNQLFGLAGLEGGDMDAEIAPPVLEESWPQHTDAPSAPRSVARALPRLDLPQPGPSPVAPSLDAQIGNALAALPLAPRPTTAEPITSPPERPSGPAFEPAMAEAVVEPAPAFEPTPRAEAEQAVRPAASPALEEVVLAPVPIAHLANEPEPSGAHDAAPRFHPDPLAPTALSDVPRPGGEEAPRALEPVEPAPEAPPVRVLEPRPRPDFREAEAEAEQGEPAAPPAPRITIGRVTVELVPDPALVARSAPPARTAAAASVIGPLGNRRMRRRLFALSRL